DAIRIDHADEGGRSLLEPDLVIYGIETSQWEGEHFTNTLRKIFPTLDIVCESSNKILGALHHIRETPGDFRFQMQAVNGIVEMGKRTTFLAVSQHGQTHSTLNATSILKDLNNQYGQKGVFVMTGETDNPIGK